MWKKKRKKKAYTNNNRDGFLLLIIIKIDLEFAWNDSEWLRMLRMARWVILLKKFNSEYAQIPLGITWNDLEWVGMAKKLSLKFFTWNGVEICSDSYHSTQNLLGSAQNMWGMVKYCTWSWSKLLLSLCCTSSRQILYYWDCLYFLGRPTSQI